jgi:hypothetical protein
MNTTYTRGDTVTHSVFSPSEIFNGHGVEFVIADGKIFLNEELVVNRTDEGITICLPERVTPFLLGLIEECVGAKIVMQEDGSLYLVEDRAHEMDRGTTYQYPAVNVLQEGVSHVCLLETHPASQ